MTGLRILFLAVICVLPTGSAAAQTYSTSPQKGIGVALGTVDGISGSWREGPEFYQGLIGLGGQAKLYLSVDRCITLPEWIPDVPWIMSYYGYGGILSTVRKGKGHWIGGLDDEDKDYLILGARLPVGVLLYLQDTPLQAMGELAPAVVLGNSVTNVTLQWSLGMRYTF